MTPERSLVPFDQQLDLNGHLHDIAPQNVQDRLFSPAPAQLAGQASLDINPNGRQEPCKS